MSSWFWSSKLTIPFFFFQICILKSVIFCSWMISRVTRGARRATSTGSLSEFLFIFSRFRFVGPNLVYSSLNHVFLLPVNQPVLRDRHACFSPLVSGHTFVSIIILFVALYLMRILFPAFIWCSFWLDWYTAPFFRNLMCTIVLLHRVVVIYLLTL